MEKTGRDIGHDARSPLSRLGLFLTSALCLSPVLAAPSIQNISLNTAALGQYEKLEITFDVAGVAASNLQMPYDANPPAGVAPGIGITVDAVFTAPDGTESVQPAFLFQNFQHEEKTFGGELLDWYYPDGAFVWKVRFSPPSAGSWQVRLRATDAGGASASASRGFTVTPSSRKGFIRVSRTDPRYFEYEDGTYFPGLGYNGAGLSRAHTPDTAPTLETMAANGIHVGRMWLSAWSIFGSQWNPWMGMPSDEDGYLPRAGLEAFDGGFRLKLAYRQDNTSWWKATRFVGWETPRPAVKRNTRYRVRVRYYAANITGPRNPAFPNYGLVVKIASNWIAAHDPGTGPGSVVTPYGGNTSAWSELTGTWTSGNTNAGDFLPYLYLTLENVNAAPSGSPAATAYIDHVWVEEELSDGRYGPNILYKPSMQHHTYFNQRDSRAFDRALEQAEAKGTYVRPVILEKDEYIQNHIDLGGNLRTDDPPGLFYGSGSSLTAVRWYQRAWWRYLQARWGYSTAIHSWELVNEGDPGDPDHYALINDLGAFMRQFRPNHHMVSSSNWHSFPAASWRNQPNIDFADVHYYQPRSATAELNDTALADYNRSLQYGALRPGGAGMPVIRGETGFVESGSTPPIPDFTADTQGLWLHKFLWAQINPGGMIESYWYVGEHITPAGRDHRPRYKTYYNFIKDVPLSDGHYQDAQATPSDTALRAWGQKDLVHGRAHLWIQNVAHTWKNVVDGAAIPHVSGTVTVGGFQPSETYVADWHDTYQPDAALQLVRSETLTASGDGTLVLPVNGLGTDVAVKIRPTVSDNLSPARPRRLRKR